MQIKDAHQFKPLLAEIEDSPVSPLGRLIFWLVILTILFFIAWAIIGQVDIVISATGKVIPSGQVKVVQPLEAGVIRKILVTEGDHVKKNQVLMEIDPSSVSPEMETNSKNLEYARLEQTRLRASVAGSDFVPPDMVSDRSASATQMQLFEASRNNLKKQLRMKDEELEKVGQQIHAAESEKHVNEELLGVALEKEARLKQVLDLIARDEYEKVTNDALTYKSKMTQADCKLLELGHEKIKIEEEIEHIKEESRGSDLKELADKQKQTTELDAKLRITTFQNAQKLVLSPVDGNVDTLFIHTVGGVVTPAEKLISIVPDNVPLLIQASVLNKDIGFVRSKLPVAIKVDTFDFQKYGMFQGQVALVAHDSRQDDKLGQVFDVYVKPTTRFLSIDGKKEALQPGMTVTTEIKIGKRRIVEFFIYPLIKYLHEGMSVR